MSVKEYILNNVTRLPNFISGFLLKLNIFPRLIFGVSCVEYTERFHVGELSSEALDCDLLDVVNHAIEYVPYYKKNTALL